MARKICGFSRRLARRDNAIRGIPTDPPITHAERTLYVLSHVNDITYRHTPREQHHLDLPGRLKWLFDHGIAPTSDRALVAPVMAGQQALSLQEIEDLLKFVQHIDRRGFRMQLIDSQGRRLYLADDERNAFLAVRGQPFTYDLFDTLRPSEFARIGFFV